jgi:hypothetical protein
MADEPEKRAAAIFVIATSKFPTTAAQTVVLVADRAIWFLQINPESGS